jgi:hypothetical protein
MIGAFCILGLRATSDPRCGDIGSSPPFRVDDAIGLASGCAQPVERPSAQGTDADDSASLAERARRLAAEVRASASVPARDEGAFAPGSQERKDLLGALSLRDSATLAIRSTRAAGQPTSTLIVTYVVPPSSRPLKAMDARLHLVQRQKEKLEIKASGRLRFPATICADDDAPVGPADRDLAVDGEPVQIAPDRTAFVVHFRCSTSQASRQGEERHLFLVEPHGSALTQLFSFAESRSEFDRVSSLETDEHTQLRFAREQHAGYFDITLRVEKKRKQVATDHGLDRALTSETRDYSYQRSGATYVPVVGGTRQSDRR